MKKIIYIVIASLILSCHSSNEDKPNSISSEPIVTELNTTGGYAINPFTSDSIILLEHPQNKKFKTGISFPVKGRIVSKDTLKEPEIVPAKIETIINYSGNKRPMNILPDTTWVGKNNFLGRPISKHPQKIKLKLKIKKYKPSYPVLASDPKLKDNSDYSLQILDVDQKLNSSYLNALLKDNKGNIWMGSWGGGATKYDGKHFTVFSEKEGLSNMNVYALLEDKKGNIWFGTYGGGVSVFNGNEFIHYNEENGFVNNFIWSLCEDNHGNIWIGTDGKGVVKYDGKTFSNYTTDHGLSGNIVYSIIESNDGKLWFGTAKNGVCCFDGNNFYSFSEETGIKNADVWSLFQDSHNNIWLGTGEGAIKYNGKLIQYKEENGLANKYVYSIREDKNGHILFGTYGGGLDIFDGKTFENINEKNGLSNDYIKAMAYDIEGIVWMATDGGGLNKYNMNSFRHFTIANGLTDNYVNSINQDAEGKIWIGTYGGATVFDEKSFSHINIESGIKDQFIRDIMQDSKGNIWMGTDLAGAIKYDGKKFTHYTSSQGLPNNTIYSIIEDKKGNIWMGSYGGGVAKYDGENFTHYTTDDGLMNNNVYTLFEDKKGNIWIGTWGGGVTKFDGNNFTNYSEKEGLYNNHINSIFEDKLGHIWFGTNAGAVMFDGKYFTNFTSKEGLHNNVVYSFVQNKNDIWIGTENGLSCISIKKGTKNKYYIKTNIVKEDGLKGVDFILNSNFIDKKGRAWWGSGKGLEMLDLKSYASSRVQPEISFKHLLINESFIDFRNLSDSLKEIISFNHVYNGENYPLQLELPYHLNHLTFHFTAIDWIAPHKLKYQYKLEGLDDKWNPLTEHNYADYRNIPYGNYTFKVRAIGESQIWSKTFEYSFTIHPPWWHTTWFRVLVVSSFVLLLISIYRWRTAALRKRQKKLEKTVKERTAEVVHQKEIVEEKHKEITDSINYAKRLQQAILVPKEEINKYFSDNFLLYKPKDIVAGDFYFFEVTKTHIFYAAADCTGHGVPGAMLSIVCANALSRSVKEFELTDPGIILDKTRELILETFEKSKQDVKDGMDISLVALAYRAKNESESGIEFTNITWSGANNPLWYIENGEMKEIKANKQPIGKSDNPKPFTTHDLPHSLSTLFLFTDGYADQFGGPSGKKFKYANFQKLLLEYSNEKIETTNQKLEEVFVHWKNDLEQVDDICIIGIRL